MPEESPVTRSPSSTGCAPRPSTRGSPSACSPSAALDVELFEVTGSVEVAPRLGLADAIVDLVSSGSTLRTNGLRSLGALFSSEAVLIGRRGGDERARELAAVLRSVVDAREARYLMLNAPETALEAICRARPRLARAEHPAADRARHGRRARARPGGRRLAPPPAARGRRRSSILLVPVERMLA